MFKTCLLLVLVGVPSYHKSFYLILCSFVQILSIVNALLHDEFDSRDIHYLLATATSIWEIILNTLTTLYKPVSTSSLLLCWILFISFKKIKLENNHNRVIILNLAGHQLKGALKCRKSVIYSEKSFGGISCCKQTLVRHDFEYFRAAHSENRRSELQLLRKQRGRFVLSIHLWRGLSRRAATLRYS